VGFVQAAGRHSEDTPLQGCQNELSQLLEQLGMEAISVVDQRTAEQIEEEKKAAIQKRTEELEKEAEESGILHLPLSVTIACVCVCGSVLCLHGAHWSLDCRLA
jgi:hypothetical protein